MILEWPRDEARLAEFRGKTVTLAFGRRAVFVKTTTVPDAPIAELRRILAVRAPELFPLGAGDAAFDVRPTNEVGPSGRLAVVSAVSATELRRALAVLAAAGVKVERVVPAAASAETAAKAAGLADAVVVSPVAEGLAVDLVSGGILRYSRVVPVGSDLQAEAVRTATAANVPVPPIHQVAGGAEAIAEDGFRFELPEVVATREANRARSKILFSGILFLASLTIAFLIWSDRDDYLKIENARIADAKRKTTREKRILKEIETTANASAAVNNALERAFKPAQRASEVATLAGNRLPTGAWLTGIVYERGKASSFRGTARNSDDVATYLNRLRGERRLRNVELLFATDAAIGKVPIVQFSVSAFPVGNVPLIDADTGGRR